MALNHILYGISSLAIANVCVRPMSLQETLPVLVLKCGVTPSSSFYRHKGWHHWHVACAPTEVTSALRERSACELQERGSCLHPRTSSGPGPAGPECPRDPQSRGADLLILFPLFPEDSVGGCLELVSAPGLGSAFLVSLGLAWSPGLTVGHHL